MKKMVILLTVLATIFLAVPLGFSGLKDRFTDLVNLVSNYIEFEGATKDAYETKLVPAEPTADRTITLPDKTGTVPVVLTGSATWNPASLVDAAGATSAAITVTGAVLGDFVLASAPYDLADCTVTAYVQAADTVEIRLQNESAATFDGASGTWRVMVFKQ